MHLIVLLLVELKSLLHFFQNMNAIIQNINFFTQLRNLYFMMMLQIYKLDLQRFYNFLKFLILHNIAIAFILFLNSFSLQGQKNVCFLALSIIFKFFMLFFHKSYFLKNRIDLFLKKSVLILEFLNVFKIFLLAIGLQIEDSILEDFVDEPDEIFLGLLIKGSYSVDMFLFVGGLRETGENYFE